MNQTIKNGWSYDTLLFQFKSDLARSIMKNQYILNLTTLKENCIEIKLESAIDEEQNMR